MESLEKLFTPLKRISLSTMVGAGSTATGFSALTGGATGAGAGAATTFGSGAGGGGATLGAGAGSIGIFFANLADNGLGLGATSGDRVVSIKDSGVTAGGDGGGKIWL